MTTALFVTRAQPFHKGHLSAIRQLLKKHSKVIIAIGSAQADGTAKNPFTAKEREEMIALALKGARLKNWEIVRISDVFDDKGWVSRVSKVCKFDVVYSTNPWTIRCFERAGLKAREHKLLKRDVYSGTEVRKSIVKAYGWKSLVPKEVAEYIKKIGGDKRVRELMAKGKS